MTAFESDLLIPGTPEHDDSEAAHDMFLLERKREWRRNRNAAYTARKAQKRQDKRGARRELKPFVSIDGEGAPGRGAHVRSYVLLSAGIDYIEAPPGQNLAWHECLDFLCHLPVGNEYVSFAFDYDATAMLCQYTSHDQHSGWTTLERLTRKGYAVFRKDSRTAWGVRYLPKMEFRVTPLQRCDRSPSKWCGSVKTACKFCGRMLDPSRGHSIQISDTIKLFQTTLVKAIDRWKVGTDAERELIIGGKDRRELVSYNDPAERAETLAYNQLEVRLHAEIMEKFRAAWLKAGLPLPKTWNSPGQLAKTVFTRYRVPTRKEIDALGNVPKPVWDAANHAYYGGWFEVPMFGPVPGAFGSTPLYWWLRSHGLLPLSRHRRGEAAVAEYDLTSAYPWAMTHLPCLRHSRWEHRQPETGEYGLLSVDARYEVTDSAGVSSDTLDYHGGFPMFMGLPHRDAKMRVSRPLHTTGWYWNFETAQARHQTIDVHDAWTWVADGCDCQPWEFVHELFTLRKQLDAEDKGTGVPVKLTINSFYGITAQRPRGKGLPPYLNHVVASFITAWTRTKIMRTIHEQTCEQGLPCGITVVMIATDAVFFLGDPHLFGAWDDVTEKEQAQLGDWTYKHYRKGIFVVQGGLYWEIGKEDSHSKTRGVPASVIRAHMGDFARAYKQMIPRLAEADRTDNAEAFGEAWRDGHVKLTHKMRDDESIISCQRHVGLVEGVHRKAHHELGKFIPLTRMMGFDWFSKRTFWRAPGPTEPLWTMPKVVDDIVSVPYAPELFYGVPIPPWMAEAERIDVLNTDPEWVPVERDEL